MTCRSRSGRASLAIAISSNVLGPERKMSGTLSSTAAQRHLQFRYPESYKSQKALKHIEYLTKKMISQNERAWLQELLCLVQ